MDGAGGEREGGPRPLHDVLNWGRTSWRMSWNSGHVLWNQAITSMSREWAPSSLNRTTTASGQIMGCAQRGIEAAQHRAHLGDRGAVDETDDAGQPHAARGS
jgi:hypothetical protein